MNERTTGALRWLMRSVRREILYIVMLLAVQSALSACSIGYALLMRNVIDAAVSGVMKAFVQSALWFAGLLLVQITLRAVLRWGQEYAMSAVENRLRGRLFACLMGKDYAKVTAVHSGEWLNRMQSDVHTAAEGVCTAMPQLVGTVVRLIGAAAMILMLETQLGLVLIPCGLLAGAFAWLFRGKLKMLHRAAQEKEGAVRIFMQEALGSLMVIKAFGRETDVHKQNEANMREHMRARLRRNRFSNACNVGFGAAMQGAYLLGLIACGRGILNGTMTYGTCMALMQLVGQVQSPLVSITGLMPRMIAALGSAERLMEAERIPDDGGGQAEPYDAKEYYEKRFCGFALRDIVFSYEEDGQEKRVYNGLNLMVEKGGCAAVTGPSGCGKSTLLKLLLCLYAPDSGQRLLLETDGQRELTASDRCLFAYVPQGNHLLGGSIRQALTFGDEEAMRDEAGLMRALDAACALEFVQELENGLDTVLGERGQGLSEGQLQRLAIARAVYSARPILLLDECTSALDEETEARLVEKLRCMTDKTIVIVTHRPRALTVCTQRVEMRA